MWVWEMAETVLSQESVVALCFWYAICVEGLSDNRELTWQHRQTFMPDP